MSRSSKGFADFFPTAPAVLKARNKSNSPFAIDSQHIQPQSVKGVSAIKDSRGSSALANGAHNSNLNTGPHHDEREVNKTDLANEVGSASSTSTASSVFSTKQRSTKPAPASSASNPTDLTPLTNLDSSPRMNGMQSPARRPALEALSGLVPTPTSPSIASSVKNSSPTESEIGHLHSVKSLQARPSKGKPKGYRIIYDPAMDKTSKIKEKRHREAQYQSFGETVCSTPPFPPKSSNAT